MSAASAAKRVVDIQTCVASRSGSVGLVHASQSLMELSMLPDSLDGGPAVA